jgi:hypothetical protein
VQKHTYLGLEVSSHALALIGISIFNSLFIFSLYQAIKQLDPIIGVDVSEDGKFILATCKTYILVIDTEAKNAEGATLNGFKKSLGGQKV